MTYNNRKIAVNTLFLYLRKVLSLIISLYTSRVVLEMLGVTEFGIYGLVGSIVAVFSALRGLFASSIQRYINICKGKNSAVDVSKIFSIGLKIHVWIAVVFFIIVETTGWFLIPHLNIPPGNYVVSQWVLLFSVLAAVVSILTVPYDALIIANEKFKAYAIIALIEYILRLGIVFLLIFSPFSRIVFYSILVLLASLIVRLINAIYCKRKFGEEAIYRNVKDKRLLLDMTKFAGWQFFGNLGYTLTNNGINFIINIVGGVVVNAARTIAYQIMQAVYQFIGDINVSFQPQAMMTYAKNQKEDFLRLLILNSKATISIALIFSFPIIMLTSQILKFWLGEVPEYTVSFVQSILLYMVIRSLHGPIDMAFKCYGNLKRYQLTECVILLSNLPIVWCVLKLGMPYYSAFLIMGIIELIDLLTIIGIARKQFGFNIREYARAVLFPTSIAFAVFSALFFINQVHPILYSTSKILYLFAISSILIIIATVTVLVIIFSHTERRKIISIILRSKSYA